MSGWSFVFPEIILLATAFVCVALPRRKNHCALLHPFGIALFGIFLSALCVIYTRCGAAQAGTVFVFDALTLFCRILLLLCAGLIFFSGFEYVNREEMGRFACLVLCATSGGMMITGARDFILLFIGFELLSICLSILIGYQKQSHGGNEGAIKFFLIHACASGILLFGISYIYAFTGTTRMGIMHAPGSPAVLLTVGVVCVLVGISAKIGVVPFHAWMPDTSEAAFPLVGGYLVTVPVIAGITVLIRIFSAYGIHHDHHITAVMMGLAVITMSVGNIAALFQKSLKKLFAFSAIAHVGYMLAGIVVGLPRGTEGVLISLIAYVFMHIGVFTMLLTLKDKARTGEVEDCAGLAKKSLVHAFMLSVFILSLVGMPITAGFIAKFYICAAGFEAHHVGLAAAVVVNMIIAVYYYYAILRQIFFASPKSDVPISIPKTAGFTLVICTVGILVMGLFPELFITIARHTASVVSHK